MTTSRHTPEKPEDLLLRLNDIIVVIHENDISGFGRNLMTSEEGYFPRLFVRNLKSEDTTIYAGDNEIPPPPPLFIDNDITITTQHKLKSDNTIIMPLSSVNEYDTNISPLTSDDTNNMMGLSSLNEQTTIDSERENTAKTNVKIVLTANDIVNSRSETSFDSREDESMFDSIVCIGFRMIVSVILFMFDVLFCK